MTYGAHADTSHMRFGNQVRRSDLSATVWLSPPQDYDGGELVVHLGTRPVVIKGQPGSVVVYPSTQLHEVTPIRRGQRLVSITFIESMIPDEFLRTQLYELSEVAALEGLKMEWSSRVRLEAVKNNLLRLWSRRNKTLILLYKLSNDGRTVTNVPINRLLKPCWHPTKTKTGRAARFSRPPRLP